MKMLFGAASRLLAALASVSMAASPAIAQIDPYRSGLAPVETLSSSDLLQVTTAEGRRALTAAQLKGFASEYQSVADCGITSAFSIDYTAAFNACAVKAVAQNKILYVPFWITVDGARLPSYSHVVCAGRTIAGFRQLSNGTGGADGQNTTVGFLDPATTVQTSVEDCGFNGNATNNVGKSIDLATISNAGAVGGGSFIPRHAWRRLFFTRATGNCVVIGPTTRDSEFSQWVGYFCGTSGTAGAVKDYGADGERSNWNFGQCWSDCLLATSYAVRYNNIKMWGAGEYGAAPASGHDGTAPANFVFFKGVGLIGDLLYSQEAWGPGFKIYGQGSNEVSGLRIAASISDGDNGALSTWSCVHAFRLRNSSIQISCGKYGAGLIGTPYSAATISESSGNRLVGEGSAITSYPWTVGTNGADNNFDWNGASTRANAFTTATGYTPDPQLYRRHEITATGNISIANPGRKIVGTEFDLLLIQDATGGRTVSFGSDFIVPSYCSPTTTASARNFYRWRSDGTSWRVSACVMNQ